jgi:anti-sigma factor RsiW
MTDFAGMNWTGINGEEGAPHPAREQLLLALDGELSEGESVTLKAHLEACWKCRARLAEIETAITEFSRFDDAVLTACLPPPPNEWHGFDGRLRQLARANGAPSWRSRWRSWWTRALAGFSQLRWATALLLAGCLVAASFWLMRSTSVSAKELLQRSMQAENARLQQVADPVLYRKLQVRRQTTRATDSVMWESWRNRKGDQFRQRVADQQGLRFLNVNDRNTPPLLTEIGQILALNHLEAQRPLSAAAFDRWRTEVRHTVETVSESDAGLLLRVGVPEPYSPNAIRQASLLVRQSDWHVIALQLQVQGDGEVRFYELTEAAYEVMPLEALTVFANIPLPLASPASVASVVSPIVPTTSPTRAEAAPALSLAASLPSAAALQEAEVATLYALHQARADLGEQIEVNRENGRQIVVRGLVQNATRKAELLQALSSIALVSPHIQTIEEAVQQTQPAAPAVVGNEPIVATLEAGVTSSQPATTVNPLQQKLVEHFGGRKGMSEAERAAVNRQITQFYSAVEADASTATAEAWALRRWQERLTSLAAIGTELNSASRQRLDEMFKNYIARLRQRTQNLQARLRPPLGALVGEAVSVMSTPELPRPAKIQAVFQAVEQINRLVDQLIADKGASSLSSTAKALLTELAQLEAVLKALEEN